MSTNWRVPISATLDKALIDELDKKAESLGISRSALIRIILNQSLNQSTEPLPLNAA